MRWIVLSVAALTICLSAATGCANQEESSRPRPATVTEAANDTTLVGREVEVAGAVVPGSWNGKTNPMTFAVMDPASSNTATVAVIFDGALPNTFGDERRLTIVGTMIAGRTIQAAALNMEPVSLY